MKNLLLSIVLLPFLGLTSCASVPQQPANTFFSFDFEGSTYEIIGKMTEDGGSVNFLIHRQNDTTLFRVIDLNQDGVIDLVVTGTIGLDLANLIYKEGIRQAIEKNQLKETARTREFDMIYDNYRLQVQSYIMRWDSYQNRFVIYNRDGIILGVYLDEDSDGKLTTLEFGEFTIDDAQIFYDVILLRASEKNRIETPNSRRYIITYDKPAQ